MDLTPDLEGITKLKLFSSEEVRLIRKKRKENDYFILYQRGEGEINYTPLQYEFKLLDDLNSRRYIYDKFDHQTCIELNVMKRIVNLYTTIVIQCNDLRGQKALQSEHYHLKINGYLQKMCKQFPDCDLAWQLMARWSTNQKAFEEASKHINQGLHHNSESKLLFYEMFFLELHRQLAASVLKPKDFTRTMEVFQTILDCIANDTNVPFVFSLLTLADQHETFTTDLQKKMVKGMKEKLYRSEVFWNLLALRELQGKRAEVPPKSFQSVLIADKILADKCVLTFKEGLKHVCTPVLWKKFLSAVVYYNEFDDETRLLHLEEAYQLSKEKGELYMEEFHIKTLANLTRGPMSEKEEIFKWGILHLPKSEKLWCNYMLLFCNREHRDKMEEVFAKGIQALEEKALPLWQQKIRYYTNHRSGDHEELLKTITHIYLNGVVNQPKEVVEALQLQYLDWLVVERGLPAARKAYLSFTKEGLTMECHNKMLECELLSENPNQDVIQGILGLACKMYGKTEVDCWINYVKHIMNKDPSRLDAIYEEALRNLNADMHSTFLLRYAHLVNFKFT